MIRRDLGVMPPGDIRQCLVGLSYTQKEIQDLFNFRFDKGSLTGHSVGNIILAALEKIAGTEEAINLAGKMLNVRGQVLPVSLTPTVLSAQLMNGKKLLGEHNIDDQNSSGKASAIKSLHLSPAKVNPKVLKALLQADAIIFGPGDLYTSILPNILVKGVAEAVNKSKAKKILITNIMTKFGQSDGFKASDFVKVMEKYLKGRMGIVLANNKKPSTDVLKKYSLEKAKPIEADINNLKFLKVDVIAQDLISNEVIAAKAGDKLKRSILRHDSDKLAKLIWQLV